MRQQKHIPVLTTPAEVKSMNSSALRKFIYTYVKSNFSGKSFLNDDTNINVVVSVSSARKSAYGEAMYPKKVAAIIELPRILQCAVYNNFGNRKPNDSVQVIGYLNFKCKCIIDGRMECLRVAIKFQRDGRFYYNVEVNKNPTTPR